MYKDLGFFGHINIRSIRYMEDILADKREGYRYGFRLELLPRVCVNNTSATFHINISFLAWQFFWWHYKKKFY